MAVSGSRLDRAGATARAIRLLRLDCSPRGEQAHSARIATELVHRLSMLVPGLLINRRDLAHDPPSFVDADYTRDMGGHRTAESAADVASLATSKALIGELETTDFLVIATPMHNFTVPAVLKAWIDQVLRVGRTFETTPTGKVGRLRDRPAYSVISAGEFVTSARARQTDFLTPYLTSVLETIGITSAQFIRVEAAGRTADDRARAYGEARSQIAALPAPPRISSD